jgi:hypothetical protein
VWLADAVLTVPASRVEHLGSHRCAFWLGACRELAKLTVAALLDPRKRASAACWSTWPR